jgi:hypothetical protein
MPRRHELIKSDTFKFVLRPRGATPRLSNRRLSLIRRSYLLDLRRFLSDLLDRLFDVATSLPGNPRAVLIFATTTPRVDPIVCAAATNGSLLRTRALRATLFIFTFPFRLLKPAEHLSNVLGNLSRALLRRTRALRH